MGSSSAKLFTTRPSALALSALISSPNFFMPGPVKFPGDRALDISTSMGEAMDAAHGAPFIVDAVQDPVGGDQGFRYRKLKFIGRQG
jgi:hypothetical protein